MNKLDELILKFTEDSWNKNDRFKDKLEWIREMVGQYAGAMGIDVDEVVEDFEKRRTYSWPNYYQPANFPDLSKAEVYETLEDFRKGNQEFQCPRCGSIGKDPFSCVHRINNDGICDWTVSGFLDIGSRHVIVKDRSFTPVKVLPRPKTYSDNIEPDFIGTVSIDNVGRLYIPKKVVQSMGIERVYFFNNQGTLRISVLKKEDGIMDLPVKKLDAIGRVSIPVNIRRALGIEHGGKANLRVEGDVIFLKILGGDCEE